MIKTLMAAAVAAALAVPMIAQASAVNDNLVIAQAGGGGGPNQPGAYPPGAIPPGAPSGATARSSDFDRLDRNHDGYISRDEANNAAELNTRFSELDTNNDGKLSREEYSALHAGKRGASGATGKGKRAGAGNATSRDPNLPASGSQAPDSGGGSSSK